MSKKIEKEFWVDPYDVERFRSQEHRIDTLDYLYREKEKDSQIKITISWEEPEKTVKISESELGEHLKLVRGINFNGTLYYSADELSKRLFSKGDA